MNIFYLDEDPKLCAQYHCDKHVVKMILESAQLLCTAVNTLAGEQVTPYKSTHINHPCSLWVRESYQNFHYTMELMQELEKEWQFRFNHEKPHKSVETTVGSLHDGSLFCDLAFKYLPRQPPTKPALAMPDHCKVSSDPVKCYREYYRKEKVALHKWTGRKVPAWL